jgi:hypothetical protein
MRLKAWAAAIMLGATLTGGAAAEEAGQAALARELVQAMDMESTIGDLFDAMSPMMAASMGQELHLSASEQARLGEILAEEFRAAAPDFTGRIVGLYAENLTEQQMRDTIAFLRSPSGQAWLQTENTAQSQLERIGQEVGMRVAMQSLLRFNRERAR